MRLKYMLLVGTLLSGGFAMGYESIYPQTPVGVIEVKQLPERITLTAAAPGDAFEDRGTAFLKLFDYIKAHQVSMSVPVQASPSTNEMIFFVGAQHQAHKPTSEAGVTVGTIPGATVVSIGLRGRYTRTQYEEGLAKVQAWLSVHPEWQTNAPPYLVYWNSPFRLWFLRRAELHQPMRPATHILAPFYTFQADTIDGQPVCLSNYQGRVALVVNTASKCGFTPQYAGLEKLYQKYRERGFVVLGFPSNDFLGQEPGSNNVIRQFCTLNYGVTFPMFAKIVVRGKGQHPLYRWLTDPSTDPDFGGEISWNFNKFLIDRSGHIVARFGSRTTPDAPELAQAIERALAGESSSRSVPAAQTEGAEGQRGAGVPPARE